MYGIVSSCQYFRKHFRLPDYATDLYEFRIGVCTLKAVGRNSFWFATVQCKGHFACSSNFNISILSNMSGHGKSRSMFKYRPSYH
jgi:hypothetical protein